MLPTKLCQNPNLPSHLFSFSPSQFHRHRRIPRKFPSLKPRHSFVNPALIHSNFLRCAPNPNFEFKIHAENGKGDFDGVLGINLDDLMANDEFKSPVEFSVTQTLPPALTLSHGMESFKAAIENLKLEPPSAHSGVMRYQVAVPPSTKALEWLCQQKFSRVFPQFYFSGRRNNPEYDVVGDLENGVGEVSGMGAAAYFYGSSGEQCSLMKRYLSFGSHLRAYGFLGVSFDRTSSMLENQTGSFYFLVPQIELNELENGSFMSLTLAWDNSLACTFGTAVKSLEKCFRQIVNVIQEVNMSFHGLWMSYSYGDMVANEVQMVYVDAEVLDQAKAGAKCMQLEDYPTSNQSYCRHSASVSFIANMFAASSHGISCSLQECANINIMWASLIVEECVRLGLTYFCIAPGSRSSPLAISACHHPRTTCISCFDERSLAFHAMGYGRGSRKPAIVVTSSGTAVSNLFPAVVEASHDFVPLMLLTADRPPELLDAGANQAIDQVNHFGKYVRFFFSLPTPTDQIPARMVLTTIDSAAYRATQVPFGPVHINCPFREPLQDFPREWSRNCLSGLDLWMPKSEPFTKYIQLHNLTSHSGESYAISEVLEVIQTAKKGLLLIGAIHTEDEIWAALLMAKHLFWPVVTDILSGLRLRRILSSVSEVENHVLFIDHLDHSLLSDSVKNWTQPDVIVQIGSKITSKRISQFLELSSPHSYILVDNHPCRHDPSHIVTHRVQSSMSGFADLLLRVQVLRNPSNWRAFLKALDNMVAREISFVIHSEPLLTEPHVAHIIGEAFHGEFTLFIGNSMVIRDVDMYGKGWLKSITKDMYPNIDKSIGFHGIKVAGNRGASGIDGLLSTAIGFAVGSNMKVVCMIGDISFLHDTNGLAILNQRVRRKPMTILVINNHGGAIFGLLPIADRTPTSVLNRYFYTSHDISVHGLCSAHNVKHLLVKTKSELLHALRKSHMYDKDCVIEVESCIEDNAKFHKVVSKFACHAADRALRVLSGFWSSEDIDGSLCICEIREIKYSLYRIQLCAPITSGHFENDTDRFYRKGILLSICLDDGSVGLGEIAPMETHREDLSDAEEQLRFLLHVMEGLKLSYFLPLMEGSFSSWIWRSLGIPPSSIFPSVRCGLEMALLNALASKHSSSLSDLITGDGISSSAGIAICALVDCNGSPKEVAYVVSKLVDEGFTTVKIKVGRRQSPTEDAFVLQEIRQTVGHCIKIRADANRKWTYEQAVEFALSLKNCDLQYIEEPVFLEDDIVRFCEETGLPIALDETIDSLEGDSLNKLEKFIHPGIVAVVIKPSVVGGFENALLVAKWAQMHGKMAVISSAFESSLSLSAYIQFAHYLELQNEAIYKLQNRKLTSATAHGLGTYRWLKEDVTTDVLKIRVPPDGDTMEAAIKDAGIFLCSFKINDRVIQRTYTGEQVRSYQMRVDVDELSYSFKFLETGSETDTKVVIFLHGFLGTSQDWIPVMKAISARARCISIDLPGHGHSMTYRHINKKSMKGYDITMESVACALMNVICNLTKKQVIIVGYSMGARIALYMALKHDEKIDGAVLLSGSPGLRSESTRIFRISQDEERAHYLMAHGLECFLDIWYAGTLWRSLRDHPHFKKIVSDRARHQDVQGLAKVLSSLSVGRQMPLWEDLKQCKKPLLIIAGEKDTKFKDISQQMCTEIRRSSSGKSDNQLCEMIVIPDCGHAVHLENPLPLINVLRRFVTEVESS